MSHELIGAPVEGAAIAITGSTIAVVTDGTTVTVNGSNQLTVSACEVLKAGAAGASSTALLTDKFMALDSAGNCRVRSLPTPVVPQAGTGTNVSVTGVINVQNDGTTVKVNGSNQLTVDACEVLKAGTTGAASAHTQTDKFMVVDSAGVCRVRTVQLCCPIPVDGTTIAINNAGQLKFNGGLNVAGINAATTLADLKAALVAILG